MPPITKSESWLQAKTFRSGVVQPVPQYCGKAGVRGWETVLWGNQYTFYFRSHAPPGS